MHTEFRFRKSTAVLMTVILAGIVLAIEKGKAPAVTPYVLTDRRVNLHVLLCGGSRWLGHPVRAASLRH